MISLLFRLSIVITSYVSSESTSIRGRVIEKDGTHEEQNTRKLLIANDESTILKARYNNRETTFQEVNFFSESNTMMLEDNLYSLDELEEYKIFTPDAYILKDGKHIKDYEKEDYRIFRGKDGETEIFIAHDMERRINVIEIYDGENYTNLVSDYDSEDDEKYDEMFSMEAIEDNVAFDYKDNSTLEMARSIDTIFTMQSSCSYYRVIDVAIAFDTAFCHFSGGFDSAVHRAKVLVSVAANKYKQPGLCLNLRLSAIDGRCNINDDPYKNMRYWKSGCAGSDGYLDDFSKYWHSKMGYIPRDAAHLFTAHQMDGPIGCSGIGVLCRNAYGVNQISYFHDTNLQGILFAHELAHNCGANHIGGSGYVMNPNVNQAHYGFSSQTIYSMSAYLNSVTCLHYG